MIMTTNTHCLHEEQLHGQSRKIAELEARADYKDKRIEEIITQNMRTEEKIDKLTDIVNNLMLKSIQDDNDINQRVTALEASQQTIYRIISIVSVILAAFTFYMTYLR